MGMGVISWGGLRSVGEPCGGFGDDPALRYYYLLQLLLQLLPTTMYHLHNVEGRPRGVFIDIEIFYISIG